MKEKAEQAGFKEGEGLLDAVPWFFGKEVDK